MNVQYFTNNNQHLWISSNPILATFDGEKSFEKPPRHNGYGKISESLSLKLIIYFP